MNVVRGDGLRAAVRVYGLVWSPLLNSCMSDFIGFLGESSAMKIDSLLIPTKI